MIGWCTETKKRKKWRQENANINDLCSDSATLISQSLFKNFFYRKFLRYDCVAYLTSENNSV